MNEEFLPINLLVQVFAGLGLFFVGIKLLGRNLRDMAGGPFRSAIRKVTDNVALASLWGLVSGFLTQGGGTTTLILASLIQAGIISVRMAIPIAIWANVGCILIVFAAIFPLDFFVFFILGLAGLSLSFERPRSLVSASGAAFGLALMLFGLTMISDSAGGFTEFAWFKQSLLLTNSSGLLALGIGFGLTLIAQTHMGIVLITLAMTKGGFFDFEHAALILLGVHLGASVITALPGLHFRGRPRQIVICHIFFHLFSVSLFLILLYLEFAFGIPLLKQVISFFFNSLSGQMVAFILLLNGWTALLLVLLRTPLLSLCNRFSPPSQFEDLGRVEYLNSELLESPSTALLMGDREQLRLLKRLPDFIDLLRDGPRKQTKICNLEEQHPAFNAVSMEIHRFQKNLAARTLPEEETERLLNQQNRQELLNTLETTCVSLINEYGHATTHPQLLQFRQNIAEALDTQILTAIATLGERDPVENDFLLKMSADGSQTMEGLRKEFLKRTDDLSEEDRTHILTVTRLFERAVWSIHNFARLLERQLR